MTVYLDNNATTRPDPRVVRRVSELLAGDAANSAATAHAQGRAAFDRVEAARSTIAGACHRPSDDVVFTSGATESDNLATLGLAGHLSSIGRMHVVATAIEHKAVLEPLAALRRHGFEVTLVPCDEWGRVEPAAIHAALRATTGLVSVQHANNELGTVQPVAEIGRLLDDEIVFHVDAAQSFGKSEPGLKDERIDLIALSSHKMHGPPGVGALVASARVRSWLEPRQLGGAQELGVRSGTVPVALVDGFGLAVALAEAESVDRHRRLLAFRASAAEALHGTGAVFHTPATGALPNVWNVRFPGVDADMLLLELEGVAAISRGSACATGHADSHVLRAIGLDDQAQAETVRISWAHDTPPVNWTAFADAVERVRARCRAHRVA